MSFQKVTTTEEVLRNQGISSELLEFGSPVKYDSEQSGADFKYDAGNSWYGNSNVPANQNINSFKPIPNNNLMNTLVNAQNKLGTVHSDSTEVRVISPNAQVIKPLSLEEQLQGMSPEQLQEFIKKSQETLLTKVYGEEIPEMLRSIDVLAKSPATSMLIIRKINNQFHKSIFHLVTDLSMGINGITKLTYSNNAGEVFELPISAPIYQEVPHEVPQQTPVQSFPQRIDSYEEDEMGEEGEEFEESEMAEEE